MDPNNSAIIAQIVKENQLLDNAGKFVVFAKLCVLTGLDKSQPLHPGTSFICGKNVNNFDIWEKKIFRAKKIIPLMTEKK